MATIDKTDLFNKLLNMVDTTWSTGYSSRDSDPGIDPVELRRFTAKLAILHLITMNKISGEEYSRMYNMIESPDTENLIVTEELIKQLTK